MCLPLVTDTLAQLTFTRIVTRLQITQHFLTGTILNIYVLIYGLQFTFTETNTIRLNTFRNWLICLPSFQTHLNVFNMAAN